MRRDRLLDSPLIVLLMGLSALAMLIPAMYALKNADHSVARAFFYAFILGLAGAVVLALAITGRAARDDSYLGNLASLFLAYTVLPVFLALPFHEAVGNTTYVNAYIEMVSSLTTTGATLYEPARLPDPVHLWRGLVGWLGGLLIWISALAILAPLNLGGFELTMAGDGGADRAGLGRFQSASPSRRLADCTRRLMPIYVGVTVALFLCLLAAGDRPLVAVLHAMGTISTSGISPVGGLAGGNAGLAGEMAIFLFMFLAVSRLTFSRDLIRSGKSRLWHDPEFRFGLAIVLVVPLLLFVRHWIAAFELGATSGFGDSLRALWGGCFTILSFLTTTGYEGAYWKTAEAWSGVGASGLILMSIALMGGGVATTAGGVKLLRVYTLYMHGRLEMQRLIHPSLVGRAAHGGRGLRRQGAVIAWVFFMLFALTLAFAILLMGFLGQGLEPAIMLSVAALTTTGQLLEQTDTVRISVIELPLAAKYVFAATMVVGRLETLAIIALFNPDIWRRG